MGSGKSSVGQLVAGSLEFGFLDTDTLIEEQTGKRICQIFEESGEPHFRALERMVVARLSEVRDTVISTGGGLIIDPANLASLKTHSLVVCLWACAEAILERVSHQDQRPLLRNPDPLSTIRILLEQRGPFYREADILINTENRSIKEVAQHVVWQFRLARQTRAT